MTIDCAAANDAAIWRGSPVACRVGVGDTLLYLGLLIVLLAFGSPSGGLIDIPISFLLKNRLHLEAHEVAHFRLITAIPLYLSFVFGFIRDCVWNPVWHAHSAASCCCSAAFPRLLVYVRCLPSRR